MITEFILIYIEQIGFYINKVDVLFILENVFLIIKPDFNIDYFIVRMNCTKAYFVDY